MKHQTRQTFYLTDRRKQLLTKAMRITGKNRSETLELALKQLLVNLPEREATNE